MMMAVRRGPQRLPGWTGRRGRREGIDIVTRFLRGAAIGAVLSCGALAASSIAAVPAFADGTTSTTVAVTANKSTITSGRPVNFTAVVTPATVGTAKITGTVDWTVTGADGTVVPCTKTKALTSGGRAHCNVGKGILLAQDAPFTATASYSGDTNYGASSGSSVVSLTSGATHLHLALSAHPSSGAAITATATIVGGPASALVSGTVIFTISASSHAAGVGARCTGTATPPNANNIKTVVAATATCDLPAGWLVVPSVTKANLHPFAAWSVSAVYNGNVSFGPSFKTLKGKAKS